MLSASGFAKTPGVRAALPSGSEPVADVSFGLALGPGHEILLEP